LPFFQKGIVVADAIASAVEAAAVVVAAVVVAAVAVVIAGDYTFS
tara:strand:- start:353 stop:487 length:135 start_codon:yes stop_codon:yes gene_type:complete